MKKELENRKIAVIISVVMLFLAVPSLFPYGYFQILRWIVTGTAIYSGYISYKLDYKAWVWIMAIIAILFNPIAPIHLDKGLWVMIDTVTAVLMFISLRFIKMK